VALRRTAAVAGDPRDDCGLPFACATLANNETDTFDSYYRRYVESCIATGVEPRSREYTEAMIAIWDLIFRTRCLFPHVAR